MPSTSRRPSVLARQPRRRRLGPAGGRRCGQAAYPQLPTPLPEVQPESALIRFRVEDYFALTGAVMASSVWPLVAYSGGGWTVYFIFWIND